MTVANHDAQPSPPTLDSTPLPSVSIPTSKILLRRLIEGNVLYILSAVLTMLGCFLLMPTSSISEAEQFSRHLQSLAFLQAYELLVIATSIVIVRKLKRLSDAAILFLIEVALLFDPTFFSNAFWTLRTPESILVNVVCFVLLPLKLWVLARGLRLPLTGRAMGFLLSVGFLIYFSGALFNWEGAPVHMSVRYVILGWAFVGLALLFPWRGGVLSGEAFRGDHLTRSQKRRIPGLTIAIPCLVAILHFFEHSSVYNIDFHPVYLAPLFFAVLVGILRIRRDRWTPRALCFWIDFVGCAAVLVSLPWMAEVLVPAPADRNLIPGWMTTWTPLLIAFSVLSVLYIDCARRFDYRPALYRLPVWLGLGSILFACHVGWAEIGLQWAGSQCAEHPRAFLLLLFPGAIYLAHRVRDFWLWLGEAFLASCYFASFLPGQTFEWTPEILQGAFIVGMIFCHWHPDPRNEKATLAALTAILGFGRFAFDPSTWAALIVMVEVAGFMWAGCRFRIVSYIGAGVLQGVGLLALGAHRLEAHLNSGYLFLLVGLGLFFLGTLVTFNKSRILKWFD